MTLGLPGLRDTGAAWPEGQTGFRVQEVRGSASLGKVPFSPWPRTRWPCPCASLPPSHCRDLWPLRLEKLCPCPLSAACLLPAVRSSQSAQMQPQPPSFPNMPQHPPWMSSLFPGASPPQSAPPVPVPWTASLQAQGTGQSALLPFALWPRKVTVYDICIHKL